MVLISLSIEITIQEKKFLILLMIYIISDVLRCFPELNIAVKRSKFFPKVVEYESINAKFMLDKEINGQKKNISCVIKDSDEKKPEEIQ